MIPTDRVKKLGETYGVICLFIMFTPRVMLIKMSKMAHFLHFLLMTAKNQSNWFEQKFESSEGSDLVLSEIAKDYWVLNYHFNS